MQGSGPCAAPPPHPPPWRAAGHPLAVKAASNRVGSDRRTLCSVSAACPPAPSLRAQLRPRSWVQSPDPDGGHRRRKACSPSPAAVHRRCIQPIRRRHGSRPLIATAPAIAAVTEQHLLGEGAQGSAADLTGINQIGGSRDPPPGTKTAGVVGALQPQAPPVRRAMRLEPFDHVAGTLKAEAIASPLTNSGGLILRRPNPRPGIGADLQRDRRRDHLLIFTTLVCV